MIAFRVTVNGKHLCTAGSEDLAMLHAILNAGGVLGSQTRKIAEGAPDLYLNVGGITARASGLDDHMRWADVQPLKPGDIVQVEVLDTKKADKPSATRRVKK